MYAEASVGNTGSFASQSSVLPWPSQSWQFCARCVSCFDAGARASTATCVLLAAAVVAQLSSADDHNAAADHDRLRWKVKTLVQLAFWHMLLALGNWTPRADDYRAAQKYACSVLSLVIIAFIARPDGQAVETFASASELGPALHFLEDGVTAGIISALCLILYMQLLLVPLVLKVAASHALMFTDIFNQQWAPDYSWPFSVSFSVAVISFSFLMELNAGPSLSAARRETVNTRAIVYEQAEDPVRHAAGHEVQAATEHADGRPMTVPPSHASKHLYSDVATAGQDGRDDHAFAEYSAGDAKDSAGPAGSSWSKTPHTPTLSTGPGSRPPSSKAVLPQQQQQQQQQQQHPSPSPSMPPPQQQPQQPQLHSRSPPHVACASTLADDYSSTLDERGAGAHHGAHGGQRQGQDACSNVSPTPGSGGRRVRRPRVDEPLVCIGVDDSFMCRAVHEMIFEEFLQADMSRSVSVGATEEEIDAFVDIALGLKNAELQDISQQLPPSPPPPPPSSSACSQSPSSSPVPVSRREADVVLVDQNLQLGGTLRFGSNLARELRARGFNGLVVLFSGSDETQLKKLRDEQHADLVFSKSTAPADIAKAILEALES